MENTHINYFLGFITQRARFSVNAVGRKSFIAQTTNCNETKDEKKHGEIVTNDRAKCFQTQTQYQLNATERIYQL